MIPTFQDFSVNKDTLRVLILIVFKPQMNADAVAASLHPPLLGAPS
jgi:hypothetical protein